MLTQHRDDCQSFIKGRKMIISKAITISLAVLAMLLNVNAETTLKIVASGDAHGMVQACDCNIEPGGGLPKRASFIKSLGARDNMLLLDAGGFSAGGLYDSYTEGPKADSLKTEQMIIAMGALKYDAVGVGDDDLQYGGKWLLQKSKAAGLPLVSANCFKNDGSLFFKPYIIITRGNIKIAVTSVMTNEKLFETDQSVIIKDPLISLRLIWKEMSAKSDYQIALSHLGSVKTFELLDSIPDFDFAVNGHRKNEINALTYVKNIPVLQFGFQGKTLSYATVARAENKLAVETNGWYVISDDLSDDSNVVSAINNFKGVRRTDVYDLYIMSQCPYGLEALGGFVQFIKTSSDVNWNIWFIGSTENDTSLISLHGPGEVTDEMQWLAVKALYPSRWFEFIKTRADSAVPTEVIIKKMGLSEKDIDKWITANGFEQLSGHYLRSQRINVKASPTLHINNVPFEKRITAGRLLKAQCQSDESIAFCDSLPQCFDESDCRKKGKIGNCNIGKCEYTDAVKFTFTVVAADSAHQFPQNTVISTTEDLFSGAIVKKVNMNSMEGVSLLRGYEPDALPFYLFDKDVKRAYNYDQIESGLIERNGSLFFRKGIVRKNYFYKRKMEKDRIVIYIDPFFKDISGVISLLYSDSALIKKITIVPVIYSDPQNDLWGTEEGFRHEEALRWLVMDKFFKKKTGDYLKEYSKSPGSSYWFRILDTINIPQETFMTALRANSDMLLAHWKQLLEVSIHEPVAVMFDNREIAVAGNKLELADLLKIKK